LEENNPYHMDTHPLLIVISGPAAVGKDALIRRMKERGLPFHFVVTATDRPPRDKEIHGVDYLFVGTDAFQRMIDDGELLENAIVYGQHKGIPKEQLLPRRTSSSKDSSTEERILLSRSIGA
jgi:guanylate kinase